MSADTGIALSEVHKPAFMAATVRSGHNLHTDEPKIFEGSNAHQFLDITQDETLAFNAKIPGRLLSTVPRSRLTEERLNAALGRVNQYVFEGRTDGLCTSEFQRTLAAIV